MIIHNIPEILLFWSTINKTQLSYAYIDSESVNGLAPLGATTISETTSITTTKMYTFKYKPRGTIAKNKWF